MDDDCDFVFSIFDEDYSLPINETDSGTKEQILLVSTLYFAKNGVSSASMRDLAKIVGIHPSSFYNHFASKEVLWKEVLRHAETLYKLYFKHLDGALAKAGSFEEVLEAIFHEPKRLVNAFACYAFSLIQNEQFRDREAGSIFIRTFMDYSIDFISGWFDKCIARSLVQKFDTKTVAILIMHSVMIGLNVNIHKLGKSELSLPYDPPKMFAALQKFILGAVTANVSSDTVPADYE